MKTYRKPENIDEYIAGFPEDIQEKLKALRSTIKKAAPYAEEKISYGMPAFAMKGILVYFAAFKNHIGFFPTASGVEAFRTELTGFKISKGTIQLPMDKPLPLGLINSIVVFRIKENLKKAELKSRK